MPTSSSKSPPILHHIRPCYPHHLPTATATRPVPTTALLQRAATHPSTGARLSLTTATVLASVQVYWQTVAASDSSPNVTEATHLSTVSLGTAVTAACPVLATCHMVASLSESVTMNVNCPEMDHHYSNHIYIESAIFTQFSL